MALDLRGRRAVVIGAASGIGRALARALAAEGMDLVLVDIAEERLQAEALLLRGRGTRCEAHACDISDAAAVDALAQAVLEGGPVHGLVNSAGVAVGGPVIETSAEDWAWVVGVNLMGVAHPCRAFGPALDEAPGRSFVINVASASAFGGVPVLGAYSVTKNGVLALSEVLAAEWDPASVQVHCVCPGFVATGLLETGRFTRDEPDLKDRVARAFFPDHRHPDQVAAATLRALRARRFLVPVFWEAHLAAWGRHLPAGWLGPLKRWVEGRMWDRVNRVS